MKKNEREWRKHEGKIKVESMMYARKCSQLSKVKGATR